MSAKAHLARFPELRAGRGNPHALADDRQRVLWVLATTKNDPDLDYLTPAEVSDILCDVEGINVSRQRVAGLLQKENSAVVRRRRSKARDRYKIMNGGIEELEPPGPISMYVDPEKALSQIRKLEEILASLEGDIKICDPYVENKTIDYIVVCRNASSVKLLTANVLKETALRRDVAAFAKEHGDRLEIRVAPAGLLHDRYILHDGGMLLLGTSLNGFAKKQSFMVPLGPDIKSATEVAFNRVWANSTAF